MIETIKIEPKLSFLMIPMYFVDGLLESQLLNLSQQTNKNFEVIILDPHYNKRKDKLHSLFNYLKFNILYSEYYQDTRIPKQYDYSMWNTAALLSNTTHIILFQDYRYCNKELSLYIQNNIEDYIKIEWQICDGIDFKSKQGDNYIELSDNDIKCMFDCGYFPENKKISTYDSVLNNWGHYCISKNLWIELNGIDEHITSLHHYADLDLNARMSNYYDKNNIKKYATTIKNGMFKVAHPRNITKSSNTTRFRNGFCTESFDTNPKKPCEVCSKLHEYGDKNYFFYVMDLVNKNKYTLLYREPIIDAFKNIENEHLDKKNDFVIVQCNECFTTSQSEFWWIRTNNKKTKSSIGIGIEPNKVGRNLKKIENKLYNKNTEEKINILKNSWNNMEYFNE